MPEGPEALARRVRRDAANGRDPGRPASPAGLVLTLPVAGSTVRLPPDARAFVRAVARGGGGALLPPRARQRRDGLVEALGPLQGPEDARRLAAVLVQPAFAPFVDMLEALGPWCRALAQGHADLFARRVLGLGNAALFAPLISDAFVRCAAGGPDTAEALAGSREQFQRFLERFVLRLRRDLDAGIFGDAVRGPVVGLWASASETHNGGQRVLCLQLRGGRRIAYKPRPVDGERLFLADGAGRDAAALFAWLNACSPVSGPVRLPTLRVWRGAGADAWTYSWQDWIAPPRQWGMLDPAQPSIEGARLSPRAAASYWRSAGALAVACHAVGATDLGEGNVLCGIRPGAPDPMPYIVDMEVFGCHMARLTGTGLVLGDAQTGHPGFASRLQADAVEGPAAALFAAPGGALALRPVAAWARTTSRAAVTDLAGNLGPARYLPAMLRGMFDAWTCLLHHRRAFDAHLRRALRGGRVRVLTRLTATYARALAAQASGAPIDMRSFDQAERTQLARGDVPYFFAAAGGGPLQCLAAPTFLRARAAGPVTLALPSLRPDLHARLAWRPDLVDLATLLQDAVAHAYRDLERDAPEVWRDGRGWRLCDPALGVALHLRSAHAGEVHFDWPAANCRVVYTWSRRRIELRTQPLPAAAPRLPAVARRLRAIQRIDGALRRQWAADGFRDRALAARLARLTRAALTWLETMLDTHGWPTVARVGAQACDAAASLAQHAGRDAATLQRRCLALVRAAAAQGEVPLRHLAYLSDAVSVQAGRPQRYGSKFRRRRGRWVPYPLEQPDQVDTHRRRMGLPPLAAYRTQLQRTYGGDTP